MLIVYPRRDGGVCVLHPQDLEMSVEDIAKKDVPAGRPFKFLDPSLLPSDRYFRDAWEVDFSKPDGFGGEHGVQEEDGA